jgi:hypothetical protein
MDEDIIEKAEAYCASTNRRLTGRLGSGIHGIVFSIEGKPNKGVAALKLHYGRAPYSREVEAYIRLQEFNIITIHDFNVPELLACDDQLLALEMTVVKAPFVLDFAASSLDFEPEFSDEIWAEWNRKNEEQFGSDWPKAQVILQELRDLGIYMLDPSPGNLRFR